MWYVLLSGAAVGFGALVWGLEVQNAELRRKLARFDRIHGDTGRFVSQTTQAMPLKSFLAGPEPEEIYTEWEGMNDGL